jgi:hypothetical protein
VRKLLLALPLLFGACANEGPPRTFANNDLELVVGNSARMACSCIFVMHRDEAYCDAWVKASPDIGRWSVDRVARTVEASSFIGFAATARWVDEKHGCILE